MTLLYYKYLYYIIYLGVNRLVLHILLNHMAAFVFNNISFMLLYMLYICACWASIVFILYVRLLVQINNKQTCTVCTQKQKPVTVFCFSFV